MKIFVVLLTLGLALAHHPDGDFFDQKFDNFSINDEKKLHGLAQCFAGNGPCAPEDDEFKAIFPEVIETGCARCSPKQRPIVRQILVTLKDKHPDQWESFRKAHDPEDKYSPHIDKILNFDH